MAEWATKLLALLATVAVPIGVAMMSASVNGGLWVFGLGVTSLLLFAVVSWFARTKNKADKAAMLQQEKSPHAQTAIESPGAFQIQGGVGHITIGASQADAASVVKKAYRRARQAAEAAGKALDYNGVETARRSFQTALGDIEDAAVDLPNGEAISDLARDLADVRNDSEFVRPPLKASLEELGRLIQASNSVPADRPRIELNGDAAFHVESVGFVHRSSRFEADVMSLRLINRPSGNSLDCCARDVRASFQVFGPGAEKLPSVDARWSDTQQPQVSTKGGIIRMIEPPQLAVDFGINEAHQLNLVLKKAGSQYCYLFNNDSYLAPDFEKAAWRMEPGDYRVVVRISGVGVDSGPFECLFENPGANAGLKVKSFRKVEQQ